MPTTDKTVAGTGQRTQAHAPAEQSLSVSIKERLLKIRSFSPVTININQGASSVINDWSRVNWELIFINGQSLTQIMANRNIDKSLLPDGLLNEQE
jgi:hypothetical protein